MRWAFRSEDVREAYLIGFTAHDSGRCFEFRPLAFRYSAFDAVPGAWVLGSGRRRCDVNSGDGAGHTGNFPSVARHVVSIYRTLPPPAPDTLGSH